MINDELVEQDAISQTGRLMSVANPLELMSVQEAVKIQRKKAKERRLAKTEVGE